MEETKPKYRITPSLLNSFQELLDADLTYEQFYGDMDEPTITPEEYYEKKEKELLDAINRVPFTSEACSKGVALNELVDCIVENRKPREDMKVFRVYDPQAQEIFHQDLLQALRVEFDGFTFFFDINLVRSLADYFKDANCQYRCEATIDTSFGPVIVYGDADYIKMDIVYDLKSTSRYDKYEKFSRGWQKLIYPYALIESKEMAQVDAFEYTIVKLSGGSDKIPIISGEIYKELYPYQHDYATKKTRQMLEIFLPWIEDHRNLIYHKRIFNEI